MPRSPPLSGSRKPGPPILERPKKSRRAWFRARPSNPCTRSPTRPRRVRCSGRSTGARSPPTDAGIVDRVAITPDDKDWTWVLAARCPECGFVAAAVAREDVAAMVRANAAAWPVVLARPDVARRPDPATWSPLEYACHVRDVFRIYDYRLELMLTQDDPGYPNWDQDAT